MGQRTKYPMLISTCPNTNSSCKLVFNRIYFALRLQNVQLHLSSNVFTCHSFLWEFSLVPKNHLIRQVSCVWRTFVNYVAGWTKWAPNNITTTRGVQNKLQLLFTTCSIIEWFTGLMFHTPNCALLPFSTYVERHFYQFLKVQNFQICAKILLSIHRGTIRPFFHDNQAQVQTRGNIFFRQDDARINCSVHPWTNVEHGGFLLATNFSCCEFIENH